MYSDEELFLMLENFKNEKNWNWDKTAQMLNISIPTLFAWKKGRKMSLKGKRAILAIAGPDVAAEEIKCPFLDIIHSRWGELTTAERAEIAGKVASLADLKKDSSSTMEEA